MCIVLVYACNKYRELHVQCINCIHVTSDIFLVLSKFDLLIHVFYPWRFSNWGAKEEVCVPRFHIHLHVLMISGHSVTQVKQACFYLSLMF